MGKVYTDNTIIPNISHSEIILSANLHGNLQNHAVEPAWATDHAIPADFPRRGDKKTMPSSIVHGKGGTKKRHRANSNLLCRAWVRSNSISRIHRSLCHCDAICQTRASLRKDTHGWQQSHFSTRPRGIDVLPGEYQSINQSNKQSVNHFQNSLTDMTV